MNYIKTVSLFFILFIHVATIHAGNHIISDFGAQPNDDTPDTEAIQQAIDKCAEAGGGTVIFPSGTWLSGTIFLKSNVSVYLENGAVWQAVNDIEGFPYIDPKIMSRENRQPRRAMVYGCQLQNIKIYGEGTFYGGGDYDIFNVEKNPHEDKNYFRPFGIYLEDCSDITVEGITMKASGFWMQRYFYCDNIRLSNLNIYNHSNKNNDGIDLDGCHNVTIDNCLIDASDDALVLKSEGLRTCEDIVIINCVLSSHATPLKCGTGSLGGFKRIAISNIVIRPSKSKEMNHPLNAWGGLSGIDLLCVDGGVMEDIVINNVVMDSVETPIFIKLGNRHSGWDGKSETTPGRISNIKISNVIARESGAISSAITGYPGNYVENVQISDVYISVRGSDNPADTTTNVRENAGGYPFNRMFGSNLPSYGFYVRHAKNISFDNVEMAVENTEVRPAMVFDDAHEIYLTTIKAEQSESAEKIKSINSEICRLDYK